jgi:proton-dependent oligopeptide transporter, POT family
MFKGHPKGLFVLFFSNMGERFGYYTMLAIFTLFLQDHFGWDETQASGLYGLFLAGIYIFPLLGGVIADTWLGYGKTVTIGIIVMGIGYALLARTGADPVPMYIALGVIALGVGLFKGNLVVIVGNLYENSTVSHLRDAAFNIFYMGINIGAMFAPHVARYLKNLMLTNAGLTYDSGIPKIAHDLLAGVSITPEHMQKLQTAAGSADPSVIQQYAHKYIDVISNGYTWGFAAAGFSMVISIIIFIAFRKYYKEGDYLHKNKIKTGEVAELTPKQVKDRIVALLLVFLIVIFFWMAFHQNGSTLTFFAKNYTNLTAGKFTFLLFSIPNLLALFSVILGVISMVNKQTKMTTKAIGGAFVLAGLGILIYNLRKMTNMNQIDPELFQAFNPMFVVFLTPVIVGFFAWLHNKNTEPSAPSKIGIGMVITAAGYMIMLYASYGLPSVGALSGNTVDAGLSVSPYWLISTYFTLTIAELFLSPMGLSFVSKVAPPKLRGTMQAGWLGATAIGNYLAGFIGRFYKNWELWQFFLLVVLVAIISAVIMFSIMHIIKRAAIS